MKLLYSLFFWWTWAGILFLLDFRPGPLEMILSFVVAFAGAAVATHCLMSCVRHLLPRKKVQQRGLVIPPKGASFLTKYERTE